MIICSKCGLQNAMTSSYCRQCGSKLVMGAAQIHAAVAAHDAATEDAKALAGGRNLVALAVFVLMCAGIVRFIAVPAPPAPFLPAPELGPAVPDAPAAAAAKPASAAIMPLPTGMRIQWRADQGATLLAACGLDASPVQARLGAIAAAQLPDGGFPGPGDRIERTAIAALQLGALPGAPAVRLAHGRALAALAKAEPSTSSQRVLVLMALSDAQAITEAQAADRVLDLLDGSVPGMQALALAGLPPSLRRERLAALRSKLEGPVWSDWFDLLLGRPFAGETGTYVAERAERPTAEERIAWSVIAWNRVLMLDDQLQVLGSRLAVPPAAAGNPVGGLPELHAVLAATAPLRVPPFGLE